MKSKSCGWRSGRSLGQRSWGKFSGFGRRGMARMKDEGTHGAYDYMTSVSEAASFEAFRRKETSPLLSAEALPENSSIIDFKSFAAEYPEKLFPLVAQLRPEFQEFFIEFHILRKSQAFIGKCHGQIQTRVWQALRIIEQSIGSLILLGTNPDAEIIRPILRKAGVEDTQYGSLTFMIVKYAENQNYAEVALRVGAPTPAIRKIFRPAITALLASKDVTAVAVGAYLRSLTHQASLTGAGLSKRCKARNRRVKIMRFNAPPVETAALISFGHTEALADIPWYSFEISSDHRMLQIMPTLREQSKKIFGKKAAQIFAPMNPDDELKFGYLFARSMSPAMTRRLTRIRGIGEMSSICDDEGNFKQAVEIPNFDIQQMIAAHGPQECVKVRIGDFVEITTGPATKYCGTIAARDGDDLTVEVKFPTGRTFLVDADISSIKKIEGVPEAKRKFYGSPID